MNEGVEQPYKVVHGAVDWRRDLGAKLALVLVDCFQAKAGICKFGEAQEEAAFDVILQTLGPSSFEFCVAVLEGEVAVPVHPKGRLVFQQYLLLKIESLFLGKYDGWTKWMQLPPDALRSYFKHCASYRDDYCYSYAMAAWPNELQKLYYRCLAGL